MKRNKLTLIFLQAITATALFIIEAKAGNQSEKASNESMEERDMEMEAIGEKDMFPDLLTFATRLYQ